MSQVTVGCWAIGFGSVEFGKTHVSDVHVGWGVWAPQARALGGNADVRTGVGSLVGWRLTVWL